MTSLLRHELWGTDAELVDAVLLGDEVAFTFLVAQLSGLLIRITEMYVPSRAVAEEVVQEVWLAVLRGLPRFEGRSSLKTWIVNIAMNRAKSAGQKEKRSIPFTSVQDEDAWTGAVPADRFRREDGEFPHHWSSAPASWPPLPEQQALDAELSAVVERTCADLPLAQREVLLMRDVAGFDASDVCAALGLSQANQRVLLHRARSKVRAAIESYLAGDV